MKKLSLSESLQLYLQLSQLMTKQARRFNPGLDGIGWNELSIVLLLSQAPQYKMRRVDLAEKMGLTASGITRLLLPMEKLGLVQRESSEHDGRVSYVVITESGWRNAIEKIADAETMATSLFPANLVSQLQSLKEHLDAKGD
jgi:DNA-binding MarR family transcriptional regulator